MIVRRLKSNMAVGILGYAADIVAGDLSNLAVAATVFKDPRHLAAGVAEAVRDPMAARAWVLEKSGEMRFRSDETLNTWRLQRNELTKRRFPGREVFDFYIDHAFDLFEMMDALTLTPVWIGAYREGLELHGNDHEKAVTYADALARKIVPSHSVVDMSSLQRDRGFWGAAMLFFGYMNTIFNVRRGMGHEAMVVLQDEEATTGDRAKAIARLGWRMLALVAAYQILGEWLSGRGPEEDEDLWQWLLRKALMGLTVNDLPFGSMAEPFATQLATGRKPATSVRGGPGAPAVAVVQRAGESIARALEGDDDALEAFFDVARSLGLVFGVPTRPARAADYAADLLEGETQARPPYVPDVLGGLIYGEKEARPMNPLTTPQDLLERSGR